MSSFKVYSFVVKPASDENFAAIESLLSSPDHKEEVGVVNCLRRIGALNVECSDRVYQELRKIHFLKDLAGLEVVKPKVRKGPRIP